MEVVDNAVMLAILGAMDAGLADARFWLSLLVALAVAFVVTVPVNRALIGRGRGHAVVHQYHHGGGHEAPAAHEEHGHHGQHGEPQGAGRDQHGVGQGR